MKILSLKKSILCLTTSALLVSASSSASSSSSSDHSSSSSSAHSSSSSSAHFSSARPFHVELGGGITSAYRVSKVTKGKYNVWGPEFSVFVSAFPFLENRIVPKVGAIASYLAGDFIHIGSAEKRDLNMEGLIGLDVGVPFSRVSVTVGIGNNKRFSKQKDVVTQHDKTTTTSSTFMNVRIGADIPTFVPNFHVQVYGRSTFIKSEKMTLGYGLMASIML